jgi:hypothetical protein
LPSGAVDIVREQGGRVASKGDAKLGFGFIVGLGVYELERNRLGLKRLAL